MRLVEYRAFGSTGKGGAPRCRLRMCPERVIRKCEQGKEQRDARNGILLVSPCIDVWVTRRERSGSVVVEVVMCRCEVDEESVEAQEEGP